MSSETLSERCLLVELIEGFPDSFSQDNVAELVASKTQVCVKYVASAVDRPKQAWVLLLETHKDQIHCLQNHSKFTVTADDTCTIRLSYPPGKSLPIGPDQWTQVKSGTDFAQTSTREYETPPASIQLRVSTVKQNVTYNTPESVITSGPSTLESTPSTETARGHLHSHVTSDEDSLVNTTVASAADDSCYQKPKPQNNIPPNTDYTETSSTQKASLSSSKPDNIHSEIADKPFSRYYAYISPDSLHPQTAPSLPPKKRSSSGTVSMFAGLDPSPKTAESHLQRTQGPASTYQDLKPADQGPGSVRRGPTRQGSTPSIFPIPEATYPDMLVFRNVPETTEVGVLTMYLEVVSKVKPREVTHGDEPGLVVVTFEKDVDLNAVQNKCKERLLKGEVQLSVSPVPVSPCILVEDLCPSTSEEMVMLYFESTCSQGGPVKKVVMMKGVSSTCRCIVQFEEYATAVRVLSRTHTISKQQVKVSRYLECLGPTGGSIDPIPTPFTLDVDTHKRTLIKSRPEVAKDLTSRLDQEHARFAFTKEGLMCEYTATCSRPNPHKTRKRWAWSVRQVATIFLDQIKVLHLAVPREIWSAAEEGLKKEGFSGSSRAMYTLVPEDNECVVVGLQSAAQELLASISQKIKALNNDADGEDRRVSESLSLKPHEICWLEAISFDKKMCDLFKKLAVNIDREKYEIVFSGAAEHIKQAQAHMSTYLKNAKYKKLDKLSDTQKKMLTTKETTQYIVDELRSSDIVATWDTYRVPVIKREDVYVYAFTEEHCNQTREIIMGAIFEAEITDLTPDARKNLESKEWTDLVTTQIDKHTQTIMVTLATDGRIYITGIEAIVQEVKAELYCFLMEEDIRTEVVCFSPSRQKLLSQFCQDELKTIESSLKDEKVRIIIISEGRRMSIKGTEEGIQLAKEKLEEFDNKKIIWHQTKLSDKAQCKFLTSKHCGKQLDSIGCEYRCVISLTFENKGLMDVDDMDDIQPEYDVTERIDVTDDYTEAIACAPAVSPVQRTRPSTVSRINVNIVDGEIGKQMADVIVNTTSADLDLTNGAVSSSILSVAGSDLQAECRSRYPSGIGVRDMAKTGGHGLSCRQVFHLALDSWNTTAKQQLTHVIYSCLEEASKQNYTSIAFPALGTGKLGYPRDEVARTMFSVFDKFQTDVPTSSLREIRIVVYQNDTQTAQVFRQAESQFQPGRLTPAPRSSPATLGVLPRNAASPSAPSSALSVSTGTGINICIEDGEIAAQWVDVIVNTTSSNLDLKTGAVSASILSAAGSSLQDECKTKYPNGLQKGQIGSTHGHKLFCKEVFHVALDNWATGMDQMLGTLIFHCLEKASGKKYTSVAFPALGTGKLGYPCDILAQTFVSVVHNFQQVLPTTSLKEVRIVIYKDPKTIRIFTDMKRQMKGVPLTPTVTPQTGTLHAQHVTTAKLPHHSPASTGKRRNRIFSNSSLTKTAAPSTPPTAGVSATDNKFDIGGMTVEVVKGELTDQTVDVLVVPINRQLQITDDAIRSCLQQKCGGKVEDDLQQTGGELLKTGMVMKLAHNLKSERILYLNMERFGQNLEKCFIVCLKDQDTRCMKTLAMPPLGAGVDNAHVSARALYKAVNRFAIDRKELRELRVVTHDWLTYRTYTEVIDGKGKELPGLITRIKGKLSKGQESPTMQSPPEAPVKKLSAPVKHSTWSKGTSLFIYTTQKDSIEKAMTGFKLLVAGRVSEKTFPVEENMRAFSAAQILELNDAGQRCNVDVDVNPQIDTIRLSGDQDDVIDAWAEISRMLKAAQQRTIMKRAVSRTAAHVQWYFLEVTATGVEQMEYGAKQNRVIEDAYWNGEKTARIADAEGAVYIIDFDDMREYPEYDPSDVVSVIRRDKLTGPGHWNQCVVKMPAQWTPQDHSRHVEVIRLKSTDQEYKDVERNLKATMDKRTVSIKYVDRVQNPTLYQQYAAKKTQLEKQNAALRQNERTLWHGTGSNALANINSYGFSRSYCGKNATRFGEGVYFAVNSSYSLNPTYTPPDGSGQRYIYQCKVLTGYYTDGKQGMRFLPTRQGDVLYDSAVDKSKNPEMYIIFNDTQAYPEYLITFT